jgi:hypothetical protein
MVASVDTFHEIWCTAYGYDPRLDRTAPRLVCNINTLRMWCRLRRFLRSETKIER